MVCFVFCGVATAAPLTLGDVVRRALSKGFDMELQSYDFDIAKDSVADARSVFAPRLSATAGKNVTRIGADELLPATRSEGINTSVGVFQRLTSGADLGIGASLDRSEINPAFATLNPAYASALTLAVRQPLLKGFGSSVNRAAIRSAEIGFDNAGRSYRARALDVIRAAETAYYQLAGAREQLQVVRVSLELADRLLNEARSRRRAGMATKLDELQAQVGVSNARRAVVQAENTVKSAEDALLALAGRFELDEALGVAQLQESAPSVLPSVDQSYELALKSQPELLSARASLDLAKLDLSLAKDDLKPSLDLDLALGFNGDDSNGRRAFDRAVASESSSWQAGVTMTYPLGRTGEKARYRQSKAALNRDQLALQQLEQDTLVQVRNAVRDIQTGVESVKLAAESADLSEQQYEYESARFRAGLSTSRRVLEAQIDLENARVALVQAKLSLQTSLAVLRRIEGTGLEHYGIQLAGA
jgi:outer membrane protein TolC